MLGLARSPSGKRLLEKNDIEGSAIYSKARGTAASSAGKCKLDPPEHCYNYNSNSGRDKAVTTEVAIVSCCAFPRPVSKILEGDHMIL